MADTFRKWMARSDVSQPRDWTKILSLVLTLGPPVAVAIAAILDWGKALSPDPTFLSRVANFLVLLFITLFVAIKSPLVYREEYPRESIAVERFHFWWTALWMSFWLVYLERIVWIMLFPGIDPHLWYNLVDNALGNFTLLLLFACYIVLADYPARAYVVGGILVVLALTVVEAAGIHVTSTFDRPFQLWILILWQLLLGTLGATVIGLLVGRLESKVMKPPLFIVFALYAYAALQPVLGVLFTAKPMLLYYKQQALLDFVVQTQVLLVFGAAILKVFMFVVVYWLLDSGVLLFYFHWLRKSDVAVALVGEQQRKYLGAGQFLPDTNLGEARRRFVAHVRAQDRRNQ